MMKNYIKEWKEGKGVKENWEKIEEEKTYINGEMNDQTLTKERKEERKEEREGKTKEKKKGKKTKKKR